MARISHRAKSALGYVIAIVVLSFILGMIALLSSFTVVSEWWSLNINRHLAKGLGVMSSAMPFSMFELFIILSIVLGLVCIVVGITMLVKRKPLTALKAVLVMVIFGMAVGVAYSTLASFPYNRAQVPLPYSDNSYTVEEVNEVIDYYVADFNQLSSKLTYDNNGYAISPYTELELSILIAEEYKRLDVYNYYYPYTPKPKTILNNWFLTQSHIAGITFLPTGEAHYNKAAPPSTIPQTIAHELAHAKGVMREGDANMTAYYLLITSTNDYLRYCGYVDSFWHIQNIWYHNYNDTSDMTRPYDMLNDSIKSEMVANSKFWSSIDSIFDEISSFFNNIYLKLNGAINGTGSYWDTGDSDTTVGDDGEEIIVVKYSRTEKMFLHVYEQGSGRT